MLTQDLFPAAAAPPGWGSSLLVFLLASAGALFRLPPALVDTVWAEDGNVFLQDALDSSGPGTLTASYNGYLHLYPRLVAELATVLPVEWAGWLFSIGAALAVGAASWAVWDLGAGLIRSWPVRASLSAGVVLVPAGALEAVDNVANSHWYLVTAAFWALLARDRGRAHTALRVLIVVLAVLSDPLAAVLAPLAVLGVVAARSWRDRLVPGVHLVALLGQVSVALSNERDNATPATLYDIALGYALRVVSPSAVGLDGTQQLVTRAGAWGVSALALAVAIVLAAALLLLPRVRLPLLVAGLASLAFFTVSCLFAAGVRYPPAGAQSGDLYLGSRYTIVPAVLLMTAVALAAQGVIDRLPRGAGPRLVPVALLLPIAVLLVTDYRADPQVRSNVAPWSVQVDDLSTRCTAARPSDPQTLVIAPGIPWHVDVACAELLDG